MKTIHFIICGLTAMLLVGLATLAFAQNDMATARRQMNKELEKQFIRFDLLNGLNAKLEIVQSSDFFEKLGLSQDEAIERSRRVMADTHPILLNDDPVYRSLQDEREKLNPFHPNATEEARKKFFDIRVKMIEMEQKKTLSLISENYTPDQLKKIDEFLISNMSETEFVFPGMFEVLDLSDEQKKQLDKIVKEMEPEFEKHIDNMVEYRFKQQDTVNEKLKHVTDPEEWRRIRNDLDFVRKYLAELKPERDIMMKSGEGLAIKLKFKMFDVLTDEQWNRLLKLVNDPPDYFKKEIEQRRKDRKEIDDINNDKTDVWNSWKPGDAIPEGYLKHREERSKPFPTQE